MPSNHSEGEIYIYILGRHLIHFRETSNRFRETSSRFQGDIQNISERRPKNFRVPSNHSEGEIYIYIYFRKTSNAFQGDIQQSSERYTHSPFPLLFLLFQLLPLVKKGSSHELKIHSLISKGGGGEVLPCMSYKGMYDAKKWGFRVVLVRN